MKKALVLAGIVGAVLWWFGYKTGKAAGPDQAEKAPTANAAQPQISAAEIRSACNEYLQAVETRKEVDAFNKIINDTASNLDQIREAARKLSRVSADPHRMSVDDARKELLKLLSGVDPLLDKIEK